MVLLVCVTFVGQAMASTVMSYHMMSMKVMSTQEPSKNMTMMDHSHHQMMSATSDSEESSEDDCCGQTCNCFTGGCSSIATLLKSTENNPIIDLSSKISSYTQLVPSQQPTSLYRPPILS